MLAAALGSGCRKEQISVYQIPKDSEALRPMAQRVEKPIQYQMPKGWQEIAPGKMSVAKFSIADSKAELSVMSFPGEGASQLNLVNIVRENSGLAPLTDAELAKVVEPVSIGSDKGSLIDLTSATGSATNAAPNSIMVAVLPHGGATWFFKMAGAADVMATQKPALVEFLKSVSFVAGAPKQGEPLAAANESQVPSEPAPTAAVPEAAGGSKPAWSIPANWREVPPTQMLLAKFAISGADGAADVTVSSFPGDVGGPLANINRWRGMVGLEPVGAEGLDKAFTSLDVMGGKAMLVDVNGKSPKSGKDTRLVGVIWPRNGETWFYKLMGDSAAAGREKEAFLKFVQSVRYPNG